MNNILVIINAILVIGLSIILIFDAIMIDNLKTDLVEAKESCSLIRVYPDGSSGYVEVRDLNWAIKFLDEFNKDDDDA